MPPTWCNITTTDSAMKSLLSRKVHLGLLELICDAPRDVYMLWAH
jgi:hypothetical protein